MLKRCLLTLMLGLFVGVYAQDTTLLIRSDETSVQLRWFLPGNVFPEAPFTVERTAASGETQRFELASPMPLADVERLNLLTEAEYTELVGEFQAETEPLSAEEQENRELARAVLSLATVTRPNWSKVLGISYEDTDVVSGETYRYRVTTLVDGATVLVGEERITVGNANPLPVIQDLEGVADSNGINLTWRLADLESIVAYKVYRQDPGGQDLDLTPDGLFIGLQEDPETGQLSPPEVFLQDAEVEADTSYSYVVTGIDVFGRETPRSEALEVFFPDPEPLEVPVIQAVDLKDNVVELFWQPPSDERVAGLAVVRFLDPLGDYDMLTPELLPTGTTTFVDERVEGGVSYYYALLSVDAQGRQFGPGSVWATRAINLDPPQAPDGLEITATEEQFELSWSASAESDIAGYQVLLQREDKPDDLVLLTEKVLQETRFIYPVPKGTVNDFSFVVRAVNTSYVEGLPSPPVQAKLIDATAPARPLLTNILAGESAIRLSWAFSADPDVETYRVLRQTQGEAEFSVVQDGLAADVTTFTDSAVTPGLRHVYALEALDAHANVSERSLPLAATAFDSSAPTAPATLTASHSEEGVTLSWRAEGVTFFIVERSGSAKGPFIQVSDILLPDTSEFIDASGRESHYYRLVSIDAAGNIGLPSGAVQGR